MFTSVLCFLFLFRSVKLSPVVWVSSELVYVQYSTFWTYSIASFACQNKAIRLITSEWFLLFFFLTSYFVLHLAIILSKPGGIHYISLDSGMGSKSPLELMNPTPLIYLDVLLVGHYLSAVQFVMMAGET
ncbi:hypothetical protein L873DRAFT_482091 [Choiromyces venosus 120613-1]|uniref:Chitin synthase export chaperone n=1 Tax=Choiromyces venosus 120613-1 TaxID=1336337 RepID=A0A3N4JUQ1_9PEZI|nr:hypothetical protein L873DRAFT_482091 [Choiromyces venosus 120613-1]